MKDELCLECFYFLIFQIIFGHITLADLKPGKCRACRKQKVLLHIGA